MGHVGTETLSVLGHLMCRGVESSEHGGMAGDRPLGWRERLLKESRFAREAVQVGCNGGAVTVTTQAISPLSVEDKKKDIRACHSPVILVALGKVSKQLHEGPDEGFTTRSL